MSQLTVAFRDHLVNVPKNARCYISWGSNGRHFQFLVPRNECRNIGVTRQKIQILEAASGVHCHLPSVFWILHSGKENVSLMVASERFSKGVGTVLKEGHFVHVFKVGAA
jgi:hypothetical protein